MDLEIVSAEKQKRCLKLQARDYFFRAMDAGIGGSDYWMDFWHRTLTKIEDVMERLEKLELEMDTAKVNMRYDCMLLLIVFLISFDSCLLKVLYEGF